MEMESVKKNGESNPLVQKPPPVNKESSKLGRLKGKTGVAGEKKPKAPVSKKGLATKKTNAHNLSNLTLLTSNINQLRTVISSGPDKMEYYTTMLVMLGFSIGITILTTLLLLWTSQAESMKDKKKHEDEDDDKDKDSEKGTEDADKKEKKKTNKNQAKKKESSKGEVIADHITNVVALNGFFVIVFNVAITAFK